MDGDTPIKVIGLWDQITKTSCRWRQMASEDGGATWSENWIMHWTRVAALPVREVLGAVHIVSDLTLGLGEVVHADAQAGGVSRQFVTQAMAVQDAVFHGRF